MESLGTAPVDGVLAALRRQLVLQRAAIMGLGVFWLISIAWIMMRPAPIPPVLAVERLEIREPDGKPALVIANSVVRRSRQ